MRNGICRFQKKRFKGNNLPDSGNNLPKYLASFRDNVLQILLIQTETI